ncbi:MAG TPA: hypothetical protein DIW47_11980 [Bacteroidetes bacterium]|nr:hypothetical protein [Bacteroidota bacterium]
MRFAAVISLYAFLAIWTTSFGQITSQPGNQVTCSGGNTSFTFTHTFTTPAFQWQIWDGNTFVIISNSSIYSGVTTDILSVSGATSNARFRCEIVDNSNTYHTDGADLTILNSPNIGGQASSSSVCEGSNTSFSISASGANLIYKWQVNISGTWSDITSAGSGPTYSNYSLPTLNLGGVHASNNGYQYRCIVSGTCSPEDTSNAVQLSVLTVPSIVSNPGNQVVCPGQQAVFSVSSQGSNLTYKWQVSATSGSWSDISNGGSSPVYSNATSNNLTVSAINTQHTGYKYRCVVSGSCTPFAQSAEATLTVNVPPYLTAMPQNAVLCEDGNTQFAVQASGTGIMYQWQIKSGSSWTNISSAGTSPQFAGWTTSNLTLSNVPLSYNGDSLRCVVSGTCNPNAVSSSAALIVNQKPVIQSQPGNQLGCEGGTVTFSLSAVGTALSYQWQVNTGSGWTNISGGNASNYAGWNTASLQLSGLLSWNNGYYYRCQVSGACQPSVLTDSALLEVHAMPYLNSNLADQSVCEGEAATWSISSSGNNLNYTWQIDTGNGWVALASSSFSADFQGINTFQLSLSSATKNYDGDDFRVWVGNQGCGLKSSNSARLTVHAKPIFSTGPDRYICAGQSTQLNVTLPNNALNRFSWSPSIGLSNPFIQAPIATPSAIATYILIAWDTNGCYQSDTFQLDVKTNPTANAGPDQELCAGTNFSLSGSGGLAYEWMNSAGNQIGSGNLIFLEAKNSETYTLKISDQYSCTDSDFVQVKVNPLPTTNAGPDRSVCKGDGIQFNASGASTYQWLVSGLSDSLVYNPKLLATNPESIILNGWSNKGCLKSDTLSLTVFSLPLLQTSLDTQICEGAEASLSVSGASTYIWYPAIDLINPTSTTPRYKGTRDQRIYVEGKDTNGCLFTDSVQIIVNPLPIVDAGLNERICSGSSIQLNASGAANYVWTPGNMLDDSNSVSPIATPVTTVDFVVQGTDTKGCMAYDTVYVELIPNPIPTIQGETEVCKGQLWTAYKADYAGGNLLWEVQGGRIQSGIGTGQVHIAWDMTLVNGEVRLTETSMDQCQGSGVLMVNSNGKNAAKTVEVIAKANDIRTGILISRNTELDSYFWGKETKDGSRVETLDSGDYWTAYSYIDTFNYRYWMLAGNQGECLTKNYFGGYPLVSVRKFGQHTVDLYPNPNRGQFQIALNFEPIELILRNGVGARVSCRFAELGPGVWNAQAEQLSSGIYYLEVRNGEGVRRVERVVLME